MLQLQLEMMPVFVIDLVATPLSRPWAEKWQGVPMSGLSSCARLLSTAGQSDRMRPAARQLVAIHGRIKAICIYGSKVKGSAHRVSGGRRGCDVQKGCDSWSAAGFQFCCKYTVTRVNHTACATN